MDIEQFNRIRTEVLDTIPMNLFGIRKKAIDKFAELARELGFVDYTTLQSIEVKHINRVLRVMMPTSVEHIYDIVGHIGLGLRPYICRFTYTDGTEQVRVFCSNYVLTKHEINRIKERYFSPEDLPTEEFDLTHDWYEIKLKEVTLKTTSKSCVGINSNGYLFYYEK